MNDVIFNNTNYYTTLRYNIEFILCHYYLYIILGIYYYPPYLQIAFATALRH